MPLGAPTAAARGVPEGPTPPGFASGWLRGLWSRHERALVAAVCLFAAARIAVLAAAFPVFDNVDEKQHFDLVHKYSRAHVPRTIEPFDPGAAALIARYGSPEYMLPGASAPPPLWARPDPRRARAVEEAKAASWAQSLNHESTQPPLYYAVAGGWYRAGLALGLGEGPAIYWVRLLGALSWALLVWASWRFARRVFPEDRLMQAGVPLVLAVFPQRTLYSINNDVLSPLLVGLAFFGIVRIAAERPVARWPFWITGLLVGAALLDKLSNGPIAVVLAAALAARLIAPGPERRPGDAGRLALLAACALAPLGIWLGWNWIVAGDPTNSAGKLAMLGWTRKPIAAWWPHPLFTVSGIARFWGAVMTTFWRGEHVWHLEPLRTAASDLLFVTTSGVAAVGGAVLACRRRVDPPERLTAAMGLLGLAASLALLAYVSLAFDFGSCPYPSRESPFLMAGRLMIGMAAPFVILLVRTVSRALGALRIPGLAIPLLLTLCITLAASELWGTGPVFASSYNWFHLGG